MSSKERVVIKIGTKVIASSGKALDKKRVKSLVDQIAAMRDGGALPIIVTSGAIGAGMGLLGLKKRPKELSELQATASIGQVHLMHLYSEYFKARGYLVGQILLTQDDFNDRTRYLNIKNTIETLLRRKVIPVINENDTVSNEEIKFGDNDRLARLVSDMCSASKLILLTDVEGLLDEFGEVIPSVEAITPKILKLARSSQSELGTGGMFTKLDAAKKAVSAGVACIIANGRRKNVLLSIMAGEAVGTTFRSGKATYIAKNRWIAYSSKSKGKILIYYGAKDALVANDKSLLASGVSGIDGAFECGDVVDVVGPDDVNFARGIANYSASDLALIKGLKTSQIQSVLGRKERDEVIHKDNLVIL